MIVIDASAVLEILSRTPTGLSLEEALSGMELQAPHLLDLEVLSAVRRWEFSGIAAPKEAAAILDAFLSMNIRRHTHTPYIPRIWSVRHNLTPYDAAYLALAEALNAELLTMDSGLRKIASPEPRHT